jgi:prevent-host-death family protein
MEKIAVGELKTHFSELLNRVSSGEEIIITYGKKKESIAVIVPYSTYMKKNKINLGTLQHKKITIHDDFEMSEEELVDV